MADTITLQTKGILLKDKQKADAQAKADGFTSFQDVIRLFTKFYSKNKFPVNVSWGAALDSDVKESLRDYQKGRYKTLPKNKKLSDVI